MLDILLWVFVLVLLCSFELGEWLYDVSLVVEVVELCLEDGCVLFEDIFLRLELGLLNVFVGFFGVGKSSLLVLFG